jgi:hypothetical protein
LALSILTADCGPILLTDPKADVIGAAHAGWKGALGGVIEAVLDAMISLGADASNIRAAIGPSEQLLMMTNRQTVVTGIFALAASVNLVVSVLLAPLLGAMGVALAMLAASVVAAAGSAIAVRRAFGSFVHAFHRLSYRRPASARPASTSPDPVP